MEERVRKRTRQLEESLRTIRDNQAAIIEAERRAAVARLESELALAHRIQTSIVPRELSAPGMEIAALMRTASEVGGDYYDIIPIADGGFWLGIGDVSGHGLSAGLGMLMVQSGLSALGHSGAWADPAMVLSLLNRTLHQNIRRRLRQEDFITLSLFRFFSDGRFLFAGAHEDFLIGRARTRTWEQIQTHGTWLGVVENIASKTASLEGRLEEDDVMVLFTDGVIEARRQRREQFGIERVMATAAEAWAEPAAVMGRRILDRVAAWSSEVEDDQTVVVLRRRATHPGS
jgi:serine phosphatase RsbU (regulator of sigma subunit)